MLERNPWQPSWPARSKRTAMEHFPSLSVYSREGFLGRAVDRRSQAIPAPPCPETASYTSGMDALQAFPTDLTEPQWGRVQTSYPLPRNAAGRPSMPAVRSSTQGWHV